MNFFDSINVLSSGLSAERTRMNLTSSNLANAKTTRTEEGGPYRRRDPVFTSVPGNPRFETELDGALRAVAVTEVVEDPNPPRLEYDPAHPDANAEGYVEMPNVNPVEEMVNMMTSARAYEAGINAMRSAVEMAQRAIRIGK
ncbi:MAG: flagellar basal body rod protein FlgC [Myxococcota bacterium]